MSVICGQAIGREVADALGIPQGDLRSITLRVAVDEVVTVQCEHMVHHEAMQRLLPILQRYHVVEAGSAEVSDVPEGMGGERPAPVPGIEVRMVGHAQIVDLRPDDIVIITVDGLLSDNSREHIRRALKPIFDPHHVLILDGDLKLGFIARKDIDPQAIAMLEVDEKVSAAEDAQR